MARLKQLNDQMEAIQAKMFTILPKKHQCVECLSQAQVLPCVRKQIGQHIWDMTPYEAECGHSTWKEGDVMVGVQACPDHLLTGYGYGTRCVTMY